MSKKAKARSEIVLRLVRRAIMDSFRKLDPRLQIRNPVMFVVLVGGVLTTGLFFQALVGFGEASAGFILAVSLWLWFTVLFANFAEATIIILRGDFYATKTIFSGTHVGSHLSS